MSKALEGEHLCEKHQGNHSHYDKQNCTICRLKNELADVKEERDELRTDIVRFRIHLEQKDKALAANSRIRPNPNIGPNASIIATIHHLLSLLSDEERLDVFREYCTSCGTKELPCYCRRDD